MTAYVVCQLIKELDINPRALYLRVSKRAS